MLCPRCYREYPNDAERCVHDGEPLTRASKIALLRSQQSDEVGVVIGGRYRVIGLIGKGGMAHVYLAEDEKTKEPVALKVLYGAARADPRVRARFLREASAAAAIGHPNILRIFKDGEHTDGSPYLVMEFLFGESLGELLRREGALDEDIALPILAQAASALVAAHAAGIIHRDVKPDNVYLLGEPGDPYAVKLVDFGFAKLAEGGFTAVGTAIGTPQYMAPEQVLTDPVDARTDVYALGVVMYRMFTGVLPFVHQGDAELLTQQLLVPPAPPRSVAPALDEAIESVILKALRKRPENRYPTMQAFLEDLERLLGEREGEIHARGPAPESDTFEARGPLGKSATPFFHKTLESMKA